MTTYNSELGADVIYLNPDSTTIWDDGLTNWDLGLTSWDATANSVPFASQDGNDVVYIELS